MVLSAPAPLHSGMKLFAAAVTLWDYEKRGFGYNENKLSKYVWCCIALLLAAAYAPPAFGLLCLRSYQWLYF